jgi:pimeloyl-ACP methyl ester carboxylesterase
MTESTPMTESVPAAPSPSVAKPWLDRVRRLAIPSLALLAGGGLGAYLRNRLQTSHVFAPDRYPNGLWSPRAHGLEVEDAWFEAEDGAELHGWWIPDPCARGTILYCHGNNGNLTNRIDVLNDLKRLGLNLFAFDYRGYGRSVGVPTEAGLFRDVRAAWDHLIAVRALEPTSILLFGHSLGGAVAIDGALHREVAGLVVQSSFTHVRDMARVIYPRVPMHLIARNQFRSIEKVARLAMPKLFIHGDEDQTVPIELGRRLYQSAAAPKEWYEVPGAGHSELHRWGGARYHDCLQKFVRLCLSS